MTLVVGGRRRFDTVSATQMVDQSEVSRPQDAYFEPEQQTDRDERESTDRDRRRSAGIDTLWGHLELSTDSGT